MRACPDCRGFVPPALQACPHCDAVLVDEPRRGVARVLGAVAKGVLASSTAVTLMACYGVPCDTEEDCYGPDGTETAGGSSEVCDQATATQVIEGDLPVMIDGVVSSPGTNHGSCGGDGGEVVYVWTPPAAGTYVISTSEGLDTVLYVRSAAVDICGEELACNDDIDISTNNQNSRVTVDLGTEPVAIVVDGFSGAVNGAFTLTIEGQ